METKKQKHGPQIRYINEHITEKRMKLNDRNERDQEIKAYLDEKENVSAYLKDLVWADMKK